MEFFHEPKIDWMGIKWYFISLSLALALTGIISMIVHHGLVYGLDFRGGTQVDVKFSQAPNIESIRRELDRQGLHNATIQGVVPASTHAVIIGLDLQTTTSSNALDTGKQSAGESWGRWRSRQKRASSSACIRVQASFSTSKTPSWNGSRPMATPEGLSVYV